MIGNNKQTSNYHSDIFSIIGNKQTSNYHSDIFSMIGNKHTSNYNSDIFSMIGNNKQTSNYHSDIFSLIGNKQTSNYHSDVFSMTSNKHAGNFWVWQHLPYSQVLNLQNLLWHFIRYITPWLWHLEHLGLLDLSIHCLLIVFSILIGNKQTSNYHSDIFSLIVVGLPIWINILRRAFYVKSWHPP